INQNHRPRPKAGQQSPKSIPLKWQWPRRQSIGFYSTSCARQNWFLTTTRPAHRRQLNPSRLSLTHHLTPAHRLSPPAAHGPTPTTSPSALSLKNCPKQTPAKSPYLGEYLSLLCTACLSRSRQQFAWLRQTLKHPPAS